jgi:hypothetical protein
MLDTGELIFILDLGRQRLGDTGVSGTTPTYSKTANEHC